MIAPDKELRRLVDAWYDGTLAPEDGARLEERLLEDADAKNYFLDMAELEGSLPTAATAVNIKPASFQPWRRWLQMAAMFAIGAWIGGWGWSPIGSRPAREVSNIARAASPAQARITGMIGITWPDTGTIHPVEFHAESDTAVIESGLLELTFASGTRAVIEGPARFRVSGDNAMLLEHGKMVAEVPKGAEGFRVAHAQGEIIDLGTEFALDVPLATGTVHMGVFRGEIEYHPKDDNRVVKLTENHAVDATERDVVSVPFDPARFTRDLPSREFAWELKGTAGDSQDWNFDISHLIWRPGHLRAICKWMGGEHGIQLDSAELWCDGKLVGSDTHAGFAGVSPNTHDNVFDLDVPASDYKRGGWNLKMKVRPMGDPQVPVDSRGIVLVEDGLAVGATPEDFIGTWEYVHDGKTYLRSFLPDGTTKLAFLDGRPHYDLYQGGRWKVVDGFLEMLADEDLLERHLLRDGKTLIFINRPYRDARRVETGLIGASGIVQTAGNSFSSRSPGELLGDASVLSYAAPSGATDGWHTDHGTAATFEITFSGPRNFTQFHLWNYNHPTTWTLGVKDFTLEVSPDATGDTFRPAGSFVARGVADNSTVESFPFAAENVRRIRWKILGNHGHSNVVGASEIGFSGVVPPP